MFNTLDHQCTSHSINHVVMPGDTLYSIATTYGSSVGLLLYYNVGIDPSNLLPGTMLNVPLTHCPDGRYHLVQPGDTLQGIASGYNISPEELVSHNTHIDVYSMMPGTILCLPTPTLYSSDSTYVIQDTDTYYTIATSFDVSYNDMMAANENFDYDNLEAGDVLTIPPSTPSKDCNDQTYILEEGDTLTSIAEEASISATQLLIYNPEMLPSEFTAGRLICLPPSVSV